MEQERVELARSIEVLKADLSHSIERSKIELQEQASSRLDAITRKREVYGAFITTSKALAGSKDQDAFLSAYSLCYLWASEEVAVAIRRLADALVLHAAAKKALASDADQLQAEANQAFRVCMLAMRRDVGFQDSDCEYRLVSF